LVAVVVNIIMWHGLRNDIIHSCQRGRVLLDAGSVHRCRWASPLVSRPGTSVRSLGTSWTGGPEKDDKRKKLLHEVKQCHENSLGAQLGRLDAGLKVFPTSTSIIPRSEADMFPKLEVTALDHVTNIQLPVKNHVTLLLLSFKSFGHTMLSPWRESVERHFGETLGATNIDNENRHKNGKGKLNKQLQIVDLMVNVNWLEKYLAGMLTWAFKRSTPQERMKGTAILFDDFRKYRDVIGASNDLTAYIILVDENGKVRWKASGECQFGESMDLIDSISELLEQK